VELLKGNIRNVKWLISAIVSIICIMEVIIGGEIFEWRMNGEKSV
jgi:hypothetical protein